MGFRAGKCAMAAGFLALATAGPALAHPHVWVTVKSQLTFTPDGKVSAVVHDWVFDEMYSSFATQGLAKPGELVKREQFAPLARENAGGLAEIGYFTTLKIGGKSVDFGVGDGLLDGRAARPSRRVPCDDSAQGAGAGGQVLTLARRRSGIFHRLRIRRQGSDHARLPAAGVLGLGRQAEAARRGATRRS